MNEILNIPHIALHKAISEKDYKILTPLMPAGVLPVDFTTRILGTIKRGKPFERTVAAKINPWKLLAKALSKLNTATIDSIVRDSLSVTDDEMDAVKGEADRAIKKMIAATSTEVPGNITASLIVELL
jgi:hypothetical protein